MGKCMRQKLTAIFLSFVLVLGLSAPVMAEGETIAGDAEAVASTLEAAVGDLEGALTGDSQSAAADVKNAVGGLLNTLGSSEEVKSVMTFYVSGIDTRGEMTDKSRSDVNILVTVNTETKEILLVSTPRDFYVPLSISNGVPDKLTHAGIYGIDVCVDTMELLYGIDIDYYFRINFKNFIDFIDTIGPVTVHSDYDFTLGSGYHVVEGDNEMDGETALAFARERYAFASGDRQRGRDQMYVIQGVMNKLAGSSMEDFSDSLLETTANLFETDMPLSVMFHLLATQLDQIGEYRITAYSVDGTGATAKPYSMSQNAYVMIPDQATVDHAKELMREVRDGEIPEAE